ncbi:hypothetical protein NPX13_g2003 [Xylaria arbuscula]|uniref:Nucleoside phosphorylase domain-containing protein n=1 Tax=Xylaria arbuscula TaxID=114810 RepID=A0A9W8TPK5_9PEZI|nr:hypothetical protein NPX13_g2003 [Xylaria arbuscula]
MSIATSYKRPTEGGDVEHQPKRTRKTRTLKKLTHGDYAFGWVAALPIELAAARAMLDELHEELPRSRGDSNTYTLGEIGNHNIVIASLPSNGYGTVNAATAANNMHRTFPSVQDFLMVGVAGGAGLTGNVDVRLGDIVVGDRLVQYDLGKDLDHRNFKTTAIPLYPSQRLRTAMVMLRSTHVLEDSEVPALIYEIGEKYPKLRDSLSRSSLRDLLFQDKYLHTGPSSHCGECDQSKLVERRQRQDDDPEIHYGVIASGNSLIKSPGRRAQLVREWQALFFEMEGAGIIESLQCLVIRSICDYADSHKNEIWQPYAAVAAAAYAKELILAMPISDREPEIDPSLQNEAATIMNSLYFENMFSRRTGLKPPYKGTCTWIFDHHDYLTWLDPNKILGKPGTGKSTLMKHLFEKMKKDYFPISFFFNARGDHLEKSARGLYRSLLYQLLYDSSQKNLVLEYRSLPYAVQQRSIKWVDAILQDVLCRAISQLGKQKLVCFVDALDECHEDDVYEMVEYFENLGRLASEANVTLLICMSSRHYPSVPVKGGIMLTLEDQVGHSRDLELYVTDKLDVGTTDALEIRDMLLRKADGIFIWVVLVVNMLNKEHQCGRIFAVKRRLNQVPDKVTELFQQLLKRDDENMEEFLLSIQWTLYAREPLKPEEYYYAMLSGLDVEPSYLGEWDVKQVTAERIRRFVSTSSKGIAETTTKAHIPTVQFVHESVRDFLLKDAGINELWPEFGPHFESRSYDKLKQCCYTYIQARSSDSVSGRTLDCPIREFPFTSFAIRNVAHYSRHAATSFSQHCFLESFDFGTWARLYNLKSDSIVLSRQELCEDLLYLLTEQSPLGCCETEILADRPIDDHSMIASALNYPLYHGFTPLRLAIQERRGDLLRALLDRGADIEEKDKTGRTPLIYAIERPKFD